jgi:hypothetical protein
VTHAYSSHTPARSLSFFIRVRACRIAGASPLLFEVTSRAQNEGYQLHEVKFDVDAVFSS